MNHHPFPSSTSPHDPHEDPNAHNFGIFRKKRKKGLVPYILQFNFQQNYMCFVKKGWAKPKLKFSFYKIIKVSTSDTHPHLFIQEVFQSDTNQVKVYMCFAQTATSRDKITSVLQNIISGIQKRVSMFPLPHHIRALATTSTFIHYVGRVEKRGKVSWAERWLILNDQKLVVYRSKDDEFPLNIIELNYATVELLSELVFRVSCLDRYYDFKAISSFERDAWFRKLLKETAENTQKLPMLLPLPSIKHTLKMHKRNGKSNLKLARHNSDSGSDTSDNTDSSDGHFSETNSESSVSSQNSAGAVKPGGCRLCYGLSSLDGTPCFYCGPSSCSSSSSGGSAVSEDYMPHAPSADTSIKVTSPKVPSVLDNFAVIHELITQPNPTSLKTYLANSKFAVIVPVFVPATPSGSKSQLWRSQGRGEVITKPANSTQHEGLHRSLSTNSLLELNFPRTKITLPVNSLLPKSTSNDGLSISPPSSAPTSPTLGPVHRSKGTTPMFIKRAKRVDTPYIPQSPLNEKIVVERPISPPRALSPRSHANNLDSASPPRIILPSSPPKDEIPFIHTTKPLPVPPPPPNVSTASVTQLLARSASSTDWIRAPHNFPSSNNNGSLSPPPSIFHRQHSDNNISPPSSAAKMKLRPEPLRLDMPPSLPKIKKIPPPPPPSPDLPPRNPPTKKHLSPRNPADNQSISPRKKDQNWVSPATKALPTIPLSHPLPPPPPPPPPPPRPLAVPAFVSRHKLNVLPSSPSPVPPVKPNWRRSAPTSPKSAPVQRRDRATKSLPILKITSREQIANGTKARSRGGTGDRSGDRGGGGEGGGGNGGGKPENRHPTTQAFSAVVAPPSREFHADRPPNRHHPQQYEECEASCLFEGLDPSLVAALGGFEELDGRHPKEETTQMELDRTTLAQQDISLTEALLTPEYRMSLAMRLGAQHERDAVYTGELDEIDDKEGGNDDTHNHKTEEGMSDSETYESCSSESDGRSSASPYPQLVPISEELVATVFTVQTIVVDYAAEVKFEIARVKESVLDVRKPNAPSTPELRYETERTKTIGFKEATDSTAPSEDPTTEQTLDNPSTDPDSDHSDPYFPEDDEVLEANQEGDAGGDSKNENAAQAKLSPYQKLKKGLRLEPMVLKQVKRLQRKSSVTLIPPLEPSPVPEQRKTKLFQKPNILKRKKAITHAPPPLPIIPTPSLPPLPQPPIPPAQQAPIQQAPIQHAPPPNPKTRPPSISSPAVLSPSPPLLRRNLFSTTKPLPDVPQPLISAQRQQPHSPDTPTNTDPATKTTEQPPPFVQRQPQQRIKLFQQRFMHTPPPTSSSSSSSSSASKPEQIPNDKGKHGGTASFLRRMSNSKTRSDGVSATTTRTPAPQPLSRSAPQAIPGTPDENTAPSSWINSRKPFSAPAAPHPVSLSPVSPSSVTSPSSSSSGSPSPESTKGITPSPLKTFFTKKKHLFFNQNQAASV